jgi:hypothetical protein
MITKRNPKLTRNGRQRLKPLSVLQLEDLLTKTSKPKEKDKIINRLKLIKKEIK